MTAPEVVIYTKFGCGFCYRAKRLLDQKGVEYVEHDITMGGPKRDEMRARVPNAYTVPQVMIDDKAYGGFDDISALDRQGRLDPLLGL